MTRRIVAIKDYIISHFPHNLIFNKPLSYLIWKIYLTLIFVTSQFGSVIFKRPNNGSCSCNVYGNMSVKSKVIICCLEKNHKSYRNIYPKSILIEIFSSMQILLIPTKHQQINQITQLNFLPNLQNKTNLGHPNDLNVKILDI